MNKLILPIELIYDNTTEINSLELMQKVFFWQKIEKVLTKGGKNQEFPEDFLSNGKKDPDSDPDPTTMLLYVR